MQIPTIEEIASAVELVKRSPEDQTAILKIVFGSAKLWLEAERITRWIEGHSESREYSTAILNAIASGLTLGLAINAARPESAAIEALAADAGGSKP